MKCVHQPGYDSKEIIIIIIVVIVALVVFFEEYLEANEDEEKPVQCIDYDQSTLLSLLSTYLHDKRTWLK